MTYQLQQTSLFKKDCKRMKRRGLNMKELTDVIELLQVGKNSRLRVMTTV